MSVNVSQVPALDPSKLAPVALGTHINTLKDERDPLWDATAAALSQIQTALNFYQNILKQVSSNTLSQVPVLAPDGQLLGWIGVNGPDAAVFYLGYKTDTPINITAITNATPPVVQTASAHGYTTGDTVKITNDSVAAYNGNWIITVVDATHYSLNTGVASGAGAGGVSTRYFAGIWAQTAAFGGTSFANAAIKCQADGSVIITGANFILDTNGVTTTIGNLSAGAAGVAGVQVKNDTGPSQNVQMTDKGFYVRATDQATYVAQLSAPSDNGFLFLRNLSGANQIELRTSAGPRILLAAGSVSAQFVPDDLLFLNGSSQAVIDIDATSPRVVVGIGGGSTAQTVVGSASVVATNAAGTRSATLSSGGTVSGVALGGSWSLSDALIMSGVTRIDASGNVISANGFTGSQAFVVGINFGASTFTTKTIFVVSGIVTNIA